MRLTRSLATPSCHAAQACPLQPVGDRIKEIGKRHAGNEGQQDGREKHQEYDEDRERHQPEKELTAQADRTDILSHVRLRVVFSPRPIVAAMLRCRTRR